jgi:5-oxoprolinase (ATP-hydrolysing)
MIANFGLDTVLAYMRHVQDNAEASVRRVIGSLKDGSCTYPLDDGSESASPSPSTATGRGGDRFHTGTSPQHPRQLQRAQGHRHGGRPLRLPHARRPRHPAERGLPETAAPDPARAVHDQPEYPAAVIAGNTEVSQAITEALYGALGVIAGSQGTMNNFIWGNERSRTTRPSQAAPARARASTVRPACRST